MRMNEAHHVIEVWYSNDLRFIRLIDEWVIETSWNHLLSHLIMEIWGFSYVIASVVSNESLEPLIRSNGSKSHIPTHDT